MRSACDVAERIVLVCADGQRSAGALAALESSGFASVAVLDGGLRAWEAEEDLPGVVVDEDGEGGLVGAWV